jgi:cytochrome b561
MRLDEEPGSRTMHADADTALPSSGATPHHTRRDTARYCGVGGLVVVLGVLGLLPDSWLTGVAQSKIAFHALFGLLLCGLVAVRFRWWLKHSPPAHALDIRQFSRRLSRMVYLVLYLVTGAMEVISVIGAQQDGVRPTQALGLLLPTPDSQAFLIWGLVALVLIRALAFWSWRRLVRAGGAWPVVRPLASPLGR